MTWDTIIITVGRLLFLLVVFNLVLVIVAYTVVAERKILGYIQGRLGPNRVGPWGLLQPFADLLKFIFKEDIEPDTASKFLYLLAPLIATIAALMSIIVYPFGPKIELPFNLGSPDLVVTRFDVGRSGTIIRPSCRFSTAVVQRFCKPKVGGSIPSTGTKIQYNAVQYRPDNSIKIGFLAFFSSVASQSSISQSGGMWGYCWGHIAPSPRDESEFRCCRIRASAGCRCRQTG